MTNSLPRRGRPLAWHLGVLCAGLLAPMLALEAYLLVQTATAERARAEMGARDAARRIAVELDRGLTTLEAMLEVLATSEHLRAGDLGAFGRRAREVFRAAGAEVVLRDRGGRPLASAGGPRDGPPPGDTPVTETDWAALQAGRSRVTDFFPGGAGRPPRFALMVPAIGPGGERDHLLELGVPVEVLSEVLGPGDVPAGMTATVVDRRGVVIARSAERERFVGTSLPATAPTRTETRREGWRRTTDLAGTPVVLGFAKSAVAGWTTAVHLPEATFEAPLRRSLWTAAALGAGLTALAAALAFIFARRIARPIAALADIAGNGGDGAVLATPVREVNEVGRALAAARAATLAREREREDLLLTLDRAQVLACNPDGRIVAWTGGAERLFGWTGEEALGRVSHDLLATEFPRPLPEIEAELHARGEWQGEVRRRRRDGEAVAVAVQWALRRSAGGEPIALVEACNDITPLRRAEDALRRNRDLLASVLDGSADPIFAKDAEGRFVVLNQPAAAVLGVALTAAPGRRAAEFLPPEIAAALEAQDREVMDTGETRTVEEEIATPSGERRVLLSTKTPWRDGEGRTVGIIGVSRDITERRRAEALARETVAEARRRSEARRQEMEKLQAELMHISRLSEMGAMATALAHELNQPLTAVANFANAGRRLLAGGALPDAERLDAAREAMTEAAEQALRAGQIVRRLRGFVARGDAEKRLVDINALIEDSAALALTGANEQGIAARLDLAPSAPQVLADRVQVQQVVVNLIRNAVEALREAPRRELLVATAIGAGAVEISVADTGPGLPEDVAERLFQPFVTTKRHGMGVGLSISRSIVEEHGGRLLAEPNPGGGAVFRVVLPVPHTPTPEEDADAG